MKLGVCTQYRGTGGEKGAEGQRRERAGPGGGRTERASEGEKQDRRAAEEGEGEELQVYMLEHASHNTRIVNSCGLCTLRVRATQKSTLVCYRAIRRVPWNCGRAIHKST